MKILLVEDDEALVSFLTKSIGTYNKYVIDAVQDGLAGWEYGTTFEYDLLILDIALPKLDGISLCRRFRQEGYTTPILLLTAQGTSSAKVQALDAGADDYVVKPFNVEELIARMRALMRRSSTNPLPILAWGDLLLNSSTCEVSYNGHPLALTTKEYRLLEIFLWDSQHVFSNEEILDRLWSSEEFPVEATVRSHIRRLRHKLTAAGAPPDFIATLRGRGYYLKAPASPTVAPTATDLHQEACEAQQTQYLALLQETWGATKPKIMGQLGIFFQLLAALQEDASGQKLQLEARQVAHRLAGTLGTFGFRECMGLARQLEELCGAPLTTLREQVAPFRSLAYQLQQAMHHANDVVGTALADSYNYAGSFILAYIADSSLYERLSQAAADCGLSLLRASAPKERSGTPKGTPQAILLQLPPSEKGAVLESVATSYPSVPIAVMGASEEMDDRLAAIHQGVSLFLAPTMTEEEIIAALQQILTPSPGDIKVMVVDDDRDWLCTLPTLLQPWGLKVTTLADLEQFWSVLQAIQPDVLVVDVEMPQFDGFTLCQLVRSDLQWHHLPILFLSGYSDRQTQQRAFRVGADDYLYKPILGEEFALRIHHRLRRLSSACP